MQQQQQQQQFADIITSGVQNAVFQEQPPVVQWEAFVSANVMSQQECQLIARLQPRMHEYDLVSPLSASDSTAAAADTQTVKLLTVQEVKQYAQLILHLMQKIARVDALQWLTAQLDYMICVHCAALPADGRVQVRQEFDTPATYQALLKLMVKKENEQVQLRAAKCVAEIISVWRASLASQLVDEYASWCVKQFSGDKQLARFDVAIQCLIVLLRQTAIRKQLWQASAVQVVLAMLKQSSTATGPQVQYQLITCLWLWSMEQEFALQLQSAHDLVPLLVDIAKETLKEKVLRVSVAILKNMLQAALPKPTSLNSVSAVDDPNADVLAVGNQYRVPQSAAVVSVLVGTKTPQLLDSLLSRKLQDEDLVADCKWLQERFKIIIMQLTTWDEYVSELRSHRLEWGPVHTSEPLWRQNATKLTENQQELLKLLCGVLTGTDATAQQLAVACNDLTQFLKYQPQPGKRLVQDLGAKNKMMELMQHHDAEVRYHALIATQQYMTNAWEF